MVRQVARHRRGSFQRLVLAAEIEVSEVQGQSVFVVRPLLGETVGEPAHPLHKATDAAVVSLNVAGANLLLVWVAVNSFPLCAGYLRRAVAATSIVATLEYLDQPQPRGCWSTARECKRQQPTEPEDYISFRTPFVRLAFESDDEWDGCTHRCLPWPDETSVPAGNGQCTRREANPWSAALVYCRRWVARASIRIPPAAPLACLLLASCAGRT